MVIYSVWKSLKNVSSFWSITFPYCHYIPPLSLHSLIVLTFPSNHYIPTLSLHSLPIITFPSYHYSPFLSLHSHPINTFHYHLHPTLSLHSLLILTILTLHNATNNLSIFILTIWPISHDIVSKSNETFSLIFKDSVLKRHLPVLLAKTCYVSDVIPAGCVGVNS